MLKNIKKNQQYYDWPQDEADFKKRFELVETKTADANPWPEFDMWDCDRDKCTELGLGGDDKKKEKTYVIIMKKDKTFTKYIPKTQLSKSVQGLNIQKSDIFDKNAKPIFNFIEKLYLRFDGKQVFLMIEDFMPKLVKKNKTDVLKDLLLCLYTEDTDSTNKILLYNKKQLDTILLKYYDINKEQITDKIRFIREEIIKCLVADLEYIRDGWVPFHVDNTLNVRKYNQNLSKLIRQSQYFEESIITNDEPLLLELSLIKYIFDKGPIIRYENNDPTTKYKHFAITVNPQNFKFETKKNDRFLSSEFTTNSQKVIEYLSSKIYSIGLENEGVFIDNVNNENANGLRTFEVTNQPGKFDRFFDAVGLEMPQGDVSVIKKITWKSEAITIKNGKDEISLFLPKLFKNVTNPDSVVISDLTLMVYLYDEIMKHYPKLTKKLQTFIKHSRNLYFILIYFISGWVDFKKLMIFLEEMFYPLILIYLRCLKFDIEEIEYANEDDILRTIFNRFLENIEVIKEYDYTKYDDPAFYKRLERKITFSIDELKQKGKWQLQDDFTNLAKIRKEKNNEGITRKYDIKKCEIVVSMSQMLTIPNFEYSQSLSLMKVLFNPNENLYFSFPDIPFNTIFIYFISDSLKEYPTYRANTKKSFNLINPRLEINTIEYPKKGGIKGNSQDSENNNNFMLNLATIFDITKSKINRYNYAIKESTSEFITNKIYGNLF